MKTQQLRDGQRVRMPRLVYVICCDCGLKHMHKFEVVKKGKRTYLYMSAWRMNHRGKGNKDLG